MQIFISIEFIFVSNQYTTHMYRKIWTTV